MGNPTTSACTVQVPMTLSKRRHRQTLSLQLEQVGHLETSCEKTKLSASLESSPRVTEEKSVAAFLSKQAPRKPSSLTGSEECLKGVELSRAPESDRKSSGFNPFRGHKRAGSGSIIISPCKSLESTPRVKSGSLSFRKESGGSSSFRKEYGGSVSFRKESGGSGSFRKEVGGSGSFRKEVGGSSSFRREGGGSGSFRKEAGGSGSLRKEGSSSFRKDRSSAIAKIAASLFHSPTKLERSMSMSRLAHKAVIPEEVVSLRQKFQRSSDDAFPQSADKDQSGSDTSVKDIEESARPLISTASSQQHESVIGTQKDPIKDQEDIPQLISLEDDPTDAPSKVLENAPLPEATKLQLLSDCNSSYVWTKHDFSLPNGTSTENYCSPLALSECNSEEIVRPSLDQLLFTAEKVTEEELTEAAVLSSLMSEEYLTSPVFLSSEKLTPIFSPSTMSETGLRRSPCDSDACLKKCMSFEPVARDNTKAGEGGDRKAAKLRKRRRSVSASGIGAMLLKVVRVSDSGPIITRRLPKVGPEVISGAEALRAREYVLQKTAQISMGRTSESSSPTSARAGACQCDSSEHAVTKSITYSDKFVDAEVGSGAGNTVSELVQQSNIEAHEGHVDATGCDDKRATSGRYNIEVNIPDMEIDTTVSGGSCRREGPITFHEKLERVSSNLQRHTKPAQLIASSTAAPANTPSTIHAENVDERRTGWKPKKKSRSRGRSNSYDFDSLAECPARTENNSKQGAALSTLDANVAISRERSRSFVSRLQAPSATASIDIFRLAPSSISILANPSFSSSHQDRLWEEQAEAYSSGGRGTPGRDDVDPPPPPPASLFLLSPSPGSAAPALSSEDHQVPSASGSLRRSEGKQKKLGKRGRPEHTPLRSLLADDVKSGSPEGGHFLQQIMARIRGGSSKSASPKSPEVTVVKRRSTSWSSCICFSTK